MSNRTVLINRAPVLTLWAAVVAERLGFDRESALSLGKAVAGRNAQSKGQSLGIYKPRETLEPGKARPKKAKPGAELAVALLGREVPAVQTKEGIRAMAGDRPVAPESVERYLEQKFGEGLKAVLEAMTALANSFQPEALAGRAYGLYEKFRPAIPPGVKGWGAKGKLDLARVKALAPDSRKAR